MKLAWDGPASYGGSPITNYTLYRGRISGNESFLTEIGPERNYTDRGLTNGQSYYYEVTATNTAGEGPKSNEGSATPIGIPGGNIWTNPFLGPSARSSLAMAYDSAADRVILFGGSTGGNETWAYESGVNNWTNMNPSPSPGDRTSHAMAYDAQSDRVILFGGQTSSSYLADTWAYDFDNNTWTDMAPSSGPSGRSGSAMVFDAVAGRVILFGGASASGWLGDTWAYDFRANTWTRRAYFGPAPRAGPSMAYDSQGDRVILFGGCCYFVGPRPFHFADTWAYDFNNNTWQPKATGPPWQAGGEMAYDVAVDRVILVGPGSTWAYELTLNMWTNKIPQPSPPQVVGTALAYDASGDRVILFGGYENGDLGDTWAYDWYNNSWTDVRPIGAPPPRAYFANAYDTRSDRMVLFGGLQVVSIADTWSYDIHANSWANMGPASGPAARYLPAMAYDAQSDRTILFGGYSESVGGGDFGDTWAYDFDNNTWTNMMPTSHPSAREGHAMAYDPVSDRVILFGGGYSWTRYFSDTWAYDFETNTWTNMTASLGPAARAGHAITYDASADRMILFGGYDASGVNLGDTWSYDIHADVWTNLNSTHGPSARAFHATAYDSLADRVVLFGGFVGNSYDSALDDTWAFDYNNNSWADMQPAPGPSARGGHAMAYAPGFDRVILFGGLSASSADLSDTWWFLFATNVTPPSAPTAFEGNYGNNQVFLGWQPPAFDGGSPVSGYGIYRGTSSGEETLLTQVGPVLKYTDRAVTLGVRYYYQVAALNIAGVGDRSPEISLIQRTTPAPPESLSALPGNGLVGLAWQIPSSDGGSPITGYTIYRGTVSGGETWLATVRNVRTYSDAGLTNGVPYFYRVSAVNSFGEGPTSAEVSATPVTTPAAPEGLLATPRDGGMNLEWRAPSTDGGTPITGYAIYRGTSSGGEMPQATVADVRTYSDAGLTNGVRYFYQVSAINAVGEGPRSVETYGIPGAPTAPRDLQATPSGAGVDLAWHHPVSEGNSPITNYRIYRGTAPGAETFLIEVGNILAYSDIEASNDTTYYYQVSAVNALGEGPRGAEVAVTPKGGPGAPPFPWVPLVGVAVLAAGAALVALQHTRILRENVLQRKVRMLMFEYTRDHPGSSFSNVRDAVGLKNGVAAYHLRVLEKQGLLHSKSHRRHRWFYPNGDVSLWRDVPLSPLQVSLINEVRRAPGLGVRELARAVDRRASSVAYNVRALVREDLLRTTRVGSKLCCFVAGTGEESA